MGYNSTLKEGFIVKRSSLFGAVAICSVTLPVTAFADTLSARTCAASLTTDQRLIYQSVLPELTQETDLPSLIRSKVMALVTAGRLQTASAPDDAKIAGRCLLMVHQ